MSLSVKTKTYEIKNANYPQCFIELHMYNRRDGYDMTLSVHHAACNRSEAVRLRDALRDIKFWASEYYPCEFIGTEFWASTVYQGFDFNSSHEYIPTDKNDRYRIAMALGSAIKRFDEAHADEVACIRAERADERGAAA